MSAEYPSELIMLALRLTVLFLTIHYTVYQLCCFSNGSDYPFHSLCCVGTAYLLLQIDTEVQYKFFASVFILKIQQGMTMLI